MDISKPRIHEALSALSIGIQMDEKGEIFQQLEMLRNLGRPQAFSSIAATYEFGNINVTPRYDLAFEWYVKSALEENDCESYFSIGRFYFHGRHVERNLDESRKYCKIAYSKGSRIAGINLASIYIRGEGVEPDPDQAEKYLQPAQSEGYVAASAFFAKIHFMRRRYLKAVFLWISCVIAAVRLGWRDPHSPKLYALKNEEALKRDILFAQEQSTQWSRDN